MTIIKIGIILLQIILLAIEIVKEKPFLCVPITLLTVLYV